MIQKINQVTDMCDRRGISLSLIYKEYDQHCSQWHLRRKYTEFPTADCYKISQYRNKNPWYNSKHNLS